MRLRLLPSLILTGVLFLPVATSTAAGSRAARIRDYANRWLGTPYVWGGDSRAGIDCSAYLRQMFRDLFNIELPRTTRDQIDLGIDLAFTPRNLESALSPGDLIFYIDRAGIPSHVVVYMGSGQLTHSESGRGVVVDPMKHLWGRRIVARRVLVPGGASGTYAPIPAAGPIVPKEIPCPPSVTARPLEVKQLAARAIDFKELGHRDICDFRALADALRSRGGDVAKRNAAALDQHAIWLESIEALQENLLSPRR